MNGETYPKRIRKFPKPPENCNPEMQPLIDDVARYQIFLERLVSKWDVDIIMDIDGEQGVFYFDKRRQIESRLPHPPDESFFDLECRLSIGLLTVLQPLFGHHCPMTLPYFHSPRHVDIVADYCVNYLNLLEILESIGRREDFPLAFDVFWALYGDSVWREIEMNSAPSRPKEMASESPLRPREVDFCDIFEKMAKVKGGPGTPITVEIFDQAGFSFPFDATPMRKTVLDKFFLFRSTVNVSTNVKAFLGEIRRIFSTEIQLERIFKRKPEGIGYESIFVLSLMNLEWLASAEGRCEIGKRTSNPEIKEAVKFLEWSLSDDLFHLIARRLNMPDRIEIENYDKESCKELGRIAVMLIELLEMHRAIKGAPGGVEYWETEEWKTISTNIWNEEMENSTKIREIPKEKIMISKPTPVKGAASRKNLRKKRKHSELLDEAYIREWLKFTGKKSVIVIIYSFSKHFKRQTAAPRKKICRFLEAILDETGASIKISQNFSEKRKGAEIVAGFAYEEEEAVQAMCRANDYTDDLSILGVNVFRRLEEEGCLTGEGRAKVLQKRLVDIEDVVNETAALVKQKL